ncbi:hypothetical protein T01_9920 [Trichinella spiralis]|uniref:Uncharacterized protein n=1 Tax=Trichinella spiralis TaxID=6334 RepID=A0A0V1B8C3_TRISP|nr:hypothetical protein T01_9920 [Trichinella spiralis]
MEFGNNFSINVSKVGNYADYYIYTALFQVSFAYICRQVPGLGLELSELCCIRESMTELSPDLYSFLVSNFLGKE